jgi:uncharacterized protein YndB with AHSA1/START domain
MPATTIEEVFDVLVSAEDLARWWPAVYPDVRQVSQGNETGAQRGSARRCPPTTQRTFALPALWQARPSLWQSRRNDYE